MPLPVHTVEFVDAAAGQAGNGPTYANEKLVVAKLDAVPTLVGGGAGQSVTTAIAFAAELPANYAVQVTPDQDAVAFVSSKTSSGFNVVLNPRLAANTLAAGHVDVIVVA